MSAYMRLCQQVSNGSVNLMQEAFAVISAAEESLELERRAVVRLQAVFRCWSTRRVYRHTLRVVMRIQRVYRGYKDRCRTLQRVLEHRAHAERRVYHHCATVVQSRVRGFLTRLKVADFYKQKRYLAMVEMRSQAVLATAKEHAAMQQQVEEDKMKEETRRRFEATAHGLHHLLSTSCSRGILKRHDEVESQMTVFGGPVEDAIRAVQRNAPRRKFKRDLPPMATISDGADEYQAGKAINRMTKLLDEKMRTRLHSTSDFHVKKPLPPSYVTSISQATAYGLRMRWREEDKSQRIAPR